MSEKRAVEVEGASAAFLQEGEGETVLYLHGFPTSGYLWRHVMRQVAASGRFRTLAPDLPGFGDSELMKTEHTWEGLASWVDSFVEALDLAPLHLAVHDWGGLIGLRWACDHPEKVSSLCISDTSFSSRDRWHALARQWRQPGVGEKLIGEITEEGFKNMIGAAGAIPPEAAEEYWKGLSTPERRAAKLDMYRSLDFEMIAPYEPILPKVAPGRVRAVWGGNDPFVPPKQAERFRQSLGADVTVLDGVGHFIQEEAGDEVGRLHRDFLESVVD